jgi:hypothetical protein
MVSQQDPKEDDPLWYAFRLVFFILAIFMAIGFGLVVLFPWHANNDVYDLIIIESKNTRNAILFGSSLVAIAVLSLSFGRPRD